MFLLADFKHQPLPFEMVLSQKGKNQLKLNGHFYVQEKKTAAKTYWV